MHFLTAILVLILIHFTIITDVFRSPILTAVFKDLLTFDRILFFVLFKILKATFVVWFMILTVLLKICFDFEFVFPSFLKKWILMIKIAPPAII